MASSVINDFLDLLLRRGVIHHIQHDFFEYCTQSSSAGFLGKGFPCDGPKCTLGELQLHFFK